MRMQLISFKPVNNVVVHQVYHQVVTQVYDHAMFQISDILLQGVCWQIKYRVQDQLK